MTSSTVAVLHTAPATVDLFGRMLRERSPGLRIFNLLDDTILPELRDNGGDLAAVQPRWSGYARIMRDRGADLILNACSSIGELCARVEPEVGVRIIRVDAGMAREAVGRGSRIAVVATLPTTLRPTTAVIHDAARETGQDIAVDSILVEGAYEALLRGDAADHDDRILAALSGAADRNDVVVLAQASMARVAPRLSPASQAKVLASPGYAVDDVIAALGISAS